MITLPKQLEEKLVGNRDYLQSSKDALKFLLVIINLIIKFHQLSGKLVLKQWNGIYYNKQWNEIYCKGN